MTTRQTGIRCRATATDLYAACLAGAQKELATLEYMEQLKRPILSFEASAERHDGTVVPFSLRVYEPELDEKLGNFCFIECPFIRQRPFRIFGVDQEQACELSVKFINWMLEYDVVRLMDARGQEIQIPEISWPGPG